MDQSIRSLRSTIAGTLLTAALVVAPAATQAAGEAQPAAPSLKLHGKALDQRFASTDTIEVLPTDRKSLEFSYADRDTYAFMDPSTFEQIELTATQLGDVKNYLAPGGKVDVLFVDERPLSVDLPSTVSLKVIESAEGVKGDTASNVQKPAKLETGLVVQVPLFIKEGEVIRVSTVDGTYLGRV